MAEVEVKKKETVFSRRNALFLVKAPLFVLVLAVLVANVYDRFVEEPPLDEQCRFCNTVFDCSLLGAVHEVGRRHA